MNLHHNVIKCHEVSVIVSSLSNVQIWVLYVILNFDLFLTEWYVVGEFRVENKFFMDVCRRQCKWTQVVSLSGSIIPCRFVIYCWKGSVQAWFV